MERTGIFRQAGNRVVQEASCSLRDAGRISLRSCVVFDGVYENATVWMNEKLAGFHR